MRAAVLTSRHLQDFPTKNGCLWNVSCEFIVCFRAGVLLFVKLDSRFILMVHQPSHCVLPAVTQLAMFSLVTVLVCNIPLGVTSFYIINGRTLTGDVQSSPSPSSSTWRSMIEQRGFRSGSWDRFSHGFGKRNQMWNPTGVSQPLESMDASDERLTDAVINEEDVQHDDVSSSQMTAGEGFVLPTISGEGHDDDVSATYDSIVFRLFSHRWNSVRTLLSDRGMHWKQVFAVMHCLQAAYCEIKVEPGWQRLSEYGSIKYCYWFNFHRNLVEILLYGILFDSIDSNNTISIQTYRRSCVIINNFTYWL